MPLMSLGMFVFAIESVPYQELARKRAWRHARSERVGAHAASQFLGPGEETVSLKGVIAPPVIGDYSNMQVLEAMADQGEAHPLVEGNGVVWGHFTIESIDRTQQHFLPDGTPRRTEFTMELKRAK